MPAHKGGESSKRPDNRPARARYTGEHRQAANKAKRAAKEARRMKRIAASQER